MYRSNCRAKNQILILKQFSKSGLRQQVPNVPTIQVCFNSVSSVPKSSSGTVVVGVSLLSLGVLGIGGSALYAKYNNEFRKNVETEFPFSKTFFESLYGTLPVTHNALEVKEFTQQPEKHHNERVETFTSDALTVNITDMPAVSTIDVEINNILIAPKQNLPTNTPEKESEKKEISSEQDSTTAEALHAPKSGISEQDVVKQDSLLSSEASSSLSKEELDSLTHLADQAALEVVLETCSQRVKDALSDYNASQHEAVSNLKEYIHKLAEAIFVTSENEAYNSIWKSISQLETSALQFIQKTKERSAELEAELMNVKKFLETIKVEDEITTEAKKVVFQSNEALATAEAKLQAANKELQFLLDYSKVVFGASETLKNQLKQFTPDLLKLIEENKNSDILNSQFQDALLFYALQRAELERLRATESNILVSDKFNEMVSLEKDAIAKEFEQKLISELRTLEAEIIINYEKKVEEVKNEYEREMHVQLKRQASAHSEHLLDQLSAQESNLNNKHHEELVKKLNEQQNGFQMRLEKNLMYLNGIHSKINDVVNIEERQRRTQKLWVASQVLEATLKEELIHGRTRNLMPDLMSLLQIGGNCQVLQEIIASFPEDAARMGVVPEKLLLERFKRVKSACKKVGMVNEGGSILKYGLSFIKSFFVISQWYQMNMDEQIDLEKLDTYEILAKAEYFASQGDLLQAAKFISQLKGVSRKLSHDWLKETILLLETRQTANLLSAYVASLCAEME